MGENWRYFWVWCQIFEIFLIFMSNVDTASGFHTEWISSTTLCHLCTWESSSALTDCSKWRRAPIQNDKGAHKMPRTITVFSGSPRDFCEGGMHNGAQCFHWRSKLRSHKHETNNTKALTNHGILIEGHFVLDRNSKVWDSGGPQVPRGHSYISLKKRAQPI